MFVTDKLRYFFIRKAETQPDSKPPDSVSIEVPDEDGSEEDVGNTSTELGYAEGQSFIIEYVDSKGSPSTRRITVWGIKEGAGKCPVLVAKCHERNATRSFRVDRIRTVIDFDGVVQEPLEDFFTETFGMSAPIALSDSRKKDARRAQEPIISFSVKQSKKEKWNTIRAICRDRGIPLLCLIARADQEFHANELQLILEYASKCCESKSIHLSNSELDKLNGYVRRLRPSPLAVSKCLDEATKWSNREVLHLLETCAHVVRADGRVDQKELEELGFIVQDITGQCLFNSHALETQHNQEA